MALTIKKLRNRKAALEVKIFNLVDDFQQDTNLCVVRVEVTRTIENDPVAVRVVISNPLE